MGARRLSMWATLAAIVVATIQAQCAAGEAFSKVRSHSDITAAIYTDVTPANGCVRLLNATDEIGCSGLDGDTEDVQTTKGVLMHWQNFTSAALPEDIVMVVPPTHMAEALELAASSQRVRGVLVLPGSRPKSSSDASRFPLEEWAPYKSGHAWNPYGSSVAFKRYPFPVMLLGGNAAQKAVAGASYNAHLGWRGAAYVSELRAAMQGRGNSSTCLAANTCLPLGGQTVLAMLPPLPQSAGGLKDGGFEGKTRLPVTMVVAQLDSIGLFHDAVNGAEAPLSGLLAMLAAAKALGAAQDCSGYRRRLVFAAMAGDMWGAMGTRRLLWELQSGSAATAGLNLADIDQVVELGQIGQAGANGTVKPRLFVHSQKHSRGFGNASSLVTALQDATRTLPKDLQVDVRQASINNPGLPPSSLFAWLRVKPEVAGAVLADFDTVFVNRFYQSRFDDVNASDVGSVAAAAAVAASALHALAAAPEATALQVDSAAIAATVAQLQGCLVASTPAMQCDLAQALITPSGAPVQHYIGVLRTVSGDSQDPYPSVKGDLARFLWNYLANATAVRQSGTGRAAPEQQCDFSQHRCPASSVCVGHKVGQTWPDGAGRCLAATARYVPSYSTRFRCKDCDGARTFYDAFRWQVSGEADGWAAAAHLPADPMWVESNWPSGQPSLRLYQVEDPAVVRFVWLSAILASGGTAAGVAAAWFALRSIT